MAEEKNEIQVKARIQMKYLTGEAELRRLADLREKWEMDRISGINYATREGIKKRKKRRSKRITKDGNDNWTSTNCYKIRPRRNKENKRDRRKR